MLCVPCSVFRAHAWCSRLVSEERKESRKEERNKGRKQERKAGRKEERKCSFSFICRSYSPFLLSCPFLFFCLRLIVVDLAVLFTTPAHHYPCSSLPLRITTPLLHYPCAQSCLVCLVFFSSWNQSSKCSVFLQILDRDSYPLDWCLPYESRLSGRLSASRCLVVVKRSVLQSQGLTLRIACAGTSCHHL